jgi:ribonuclease HI
MPQKPIEIYTDGACLGNPGPGGYGVVLLYGEHRKELSGGFRFTTNNRMELMAAIEGLKALKTSSEVWLYSDSRYLVDAVNLKWLEGWRRRNWVKSNKEPVKNIDLWKEIVELRQRHQIKFIWVKGHNGNVENERCDALAMAAATGKNLPADVMFEPTNLRLINEN